MDCFQLVDQSDSRPFHPAEFNSPNNATNSPRNPQPLRSPRTALFKRKPRRIPTFRQVHFRASTITSTQRAGHQESLRPNLCVSNDTFDGDITSPLAKCDSQWAQGEPFQHCYLWDHCVGKASPVLSFRTPLTPVKERLLRLMRNL